ncbi:hypothetical protein FOA43_003735 [Brettanomyces nanus]|uniref:Vps72/YL1 C-terminal domain-containing protein n=1 Tax=Eeniella nana TaxID=13502 RepID=A0A875S5X1_EENNA|nr:uncharacterized protein FOA43_003735 [Brettanomyces nanus]QPG76348.1 hypothetical protein FOA43_003735 [Brettanomyces nanus]
MSDIKDSGLSSDSESESESDGFESIIATRERRANAGSRMRQLLAMEEAGEPEIAADGKEDVDLLFEEDENDDEFVADDEEGGEEDALNQITDKRKHEGTEQSEEDEEEQEEEFNLDENFSSDTEVNSSDSNADDSAGERELQKQEKLKRQKQKKREKQTMIPLIKPVTPAKPQQPQKKKVKIYPSVLPTRRRYSARRSTVEKTDEVRRRLEKEEEEKKYVRPRPKEQYTERTLEERLEEAKVTEEENTLSLNSYFEREADRKRKQRELANSRKLKLKEFLRFYSTGVYITPNDEVEEIELEKERQEELLRVRNRRKRGKRKKKTPTSEDKEVKVVSIEGSIGEFTQDVVRDATQDATQGATQVTTQNTTQNTTLEVRQDATQDNTQDATQDSQEVKQETDQETKQETRMETKQKAQQDNEASSDGTPENKNEVSLASSKIPNEVPQNSIPENEAENGYPSEKPAVEEEDNLVDKTTVDATTVDATTVETPRYEGPPQFVTVNYVSLEEFDHDPSEGQIKTFLFGEQSNLPATRRDPRYRTISIIKQDDTADIGLEQIKNEREASFKSLLKFPRFGQKYRIVEELQSETPQEEVKVEIATPAPVGIYLPNGHRKKCLINGEFASYYDPQNGIPYNSVECFKVLQGISEGEYLWIQIDKGGVNSQFKGGIGCYLGRKDQRNAKGVPDGF